LVLKLMCLLFVYYCVDGRWPMADDLLDVLVFLSNNVLT
jgi:hypothetical protein